MVRFTVRVGIDTTADASWTAFLGSAVVEHSLLSPSPDWPSLPLKRLLVNRQDIFLPVRSS